MNLKEGMTVKIQNVRTSVWDGVICKVGKIEGDRAKLIPVGEFELTHGYLPRARWDRHLKIMNMSMVNK